jgi:hypothetical protein
MVNQPLLPKSWFTALLLLYLQWWILSVHDEDRYCEGY